MDCIRGPSTDPHLASALRGVRAAAAAALLGRASAAGPPPAAAGTAIALLRVLADVARRLRSSSDRSGGDDAPGWLTLSPEVAEAVRCTLEASASAMVVSADAAAERLVAGGVVRECRTDARVMRGPDWEWGDQARAGERL